MAKLLVVDDDPFITQSLKIGLGDRGYEVFAGHNGHEGVELTHQLTPDLIIIDMAMPIMDGVEATHRIRQSSDVPIIMLTAETDEDEVVYALESGVDEYLGKPFRLNELAARVQALIRRHNECRGKMEAELTPIKQNVMSTMTHELRTPIATILNTLEILFASAEPNNYQPHLPFLEKVLHNTHVLNQLVGDLLLLAKIDEGLDVLRRPFPLYKEIERLIDKKRVDLIERDLTIQNDIPEDMGINGDTYQLRHLLYHLLDNAIKFSHNNQLIRIWAKTNDAEDVQVIIADQGVGIHPDLHQQIFERFFQVEKGDNRTYRGLGIGLSIVNAVAEAHNGNISVSSEPNAGSQFILTLPGAEADWQL